LILASIGISAAAKALVPPVIIPGAITSALNDAQTLYLYINNNNNENLRT
jgi:hypothetical protein